MGRARKWGSLLLGSVVAVTGCYGTGTFGVQMNAPSAPARAVSPVAAVTPDPADSADSPLPAAPALQPGDGPLPINLPTALQLANARAVDIAAAAERIRVAAAVLEGADVLWLPTITLGGDYNRHDGRNQDTSGRVFDNSRSSMMFGMGT